MQQKQILHKQGLDTIGNIHAWSTAFKVKSKHASKNDKHAQLKVNEQ